MASTFTDLGIEKMATGENAGTWGDKTNTNLEIVEKAIAGYVEKAITSGGTTALTIQDGDSTESTSVARHAVIKLTGTISGNSIVTVPDSIEKVYIVTNGTSGAYTVQFKTASGSGITFGVSEKTTRLVYSDGTNIVDAGFSGASDMEGRELVLDADGDTSITADTDDQIDIKIAGTDQLTIKDGALSPVTTNDIDLGTASLEFKDAFFDGTVTADAFAGPLTGNVTGNASGTAATVTGAAQSNITSLGTLTTLTVDNVIINGSTIGHTGDTDLITVASGIATVAGEVSMTTLDIGGTDVTSTAAELNLLDGKAATNLALVGKQEGTNFTGSLLVGHATSGTLDSASNNTGIGIQALDALTSGDSNVGIGTQAATAITTGQTNTIVGHTAGLSITTGSANTAVGQFALPAAVSGSSNTALGLFSGKVATGNWNVLLGKNAGKTITSGSGNVMVGGEAQVSSATGDRQLTIQGHDGTTTTTWISGDSSGNLTFAADVTVGDDLNLTTDSTVINFGADSDTTLTHTDGAGLTLNSTNKLMFNDASQFIQGASATVLDIAATDEIELTATLIEVVGNATVSGTLGVTGVTTSNAGVVVDDITIDGAEIDVTSSFTLDVNGNITLDSSGSNINFAKSGTTYGVVFESATSNLNIRSLVSDADIIFSGNDGGSTTTVLTLDMSAAGDATFNGTVTTSTGLTKTVGKETIWIPSNAMTPTTSNGAARATVETTSGRPDMEVLDFDKDSDEFAQFAVAFPKSYNLGTITFQCFWSGLAATTGVAISLQGVAMNDNETIDVAYGTAVVVTDDAQGAVEELLVTAESGAVTIAGTPADNDLCYFRVGRDVSDGNDDMAGDMRLHGIKIFFTTDAANDA